MLSPSPRQTNVCLLCTGWKAGWDRGTATVCHAAVSVVVAGAGEDKNHVENAADLLHIVTNGRTRHPVREQAEAESGVWVGRKYRSPNN